MGWGSCDGSYLNGTIHAKSLSLSFHLGVCWGVGLRDIKPVAEVTQLFSISQYMLKKKKAFRIRKRMKIKRISHPENGKLSTFKTFRTEYEPS